MHATTYTAQHQQNWMIFDHYRKGIGWHCTCGQLNVGLPTYLPKQMTCGCCGKTWTKTADAIDPYKANVATEDTIGYGDDAIVEMNEEDR